MWHCRFAQCRQIHLFNALTKAGIEAANYPFCTIEPNVGIVEVPDMRLAQLSEIVKPQKVQHAIVEFVDIAGLVGRCIQGEGLGNQFSPTSARNRSLMWCAVSRTKISFHVGRQGRSDFRY